MSVDLSVPALPQLRALLVATGDEVAERCARALATGFDLVALRACSAAAAAALLDRQPCDIVLSGAVEPAQALLSLGLTLPLIVVAAESGQEDAAGLAAGPSDLVSVVDLNCLASVVRRELQRPSCPGIGPRPLADLHERIVQTMSEGVAVFDADGRITFVNPACADLLGYRAEELIGKHWTVAVPSDQHEIVEAADQRRMRCEADRYEIDFVRRDGTRLSVLVSGSPLVDGARVSGTMAVFTDISARKAAEATEREHRVRAETLAELTIALASHTDPAAVLDEIMQQVQRVVPFQTAMIALLEGDQLRPVRWQGYERYSVSATAEHLELPLGRFPIDASVVAERQAYVVADTLNDPRWVTIPQFAWIRSHLVVPILHGEQVLGVLGLDSALPGRFSQEDAVRLRPLASAAAVTLSNARLLADARQRAAELEAIRQASLSVTAHLDLATVLNAILDAALPMLPGAADAHIFLYEHQRLVFGAALHADGRRGSPVAVPRRDGLTYHVARTGEMLVVPRMSDHPLYKNAPPSWQGAILGLPLKIGDRVVGVMNLAMHRPYDWPESNVRVLRLLADQAAVAIENARLHDEIRLHATQLEQRVAERTAQLRQANAELAQREATLTETADRLRSANESLSALAERLKEVDRLKSEFLSNVSHELRTPLSNIKLYLDLLDNGKPGKAPQYMATLHRETNLLASLIEDLLQISRFDLGKVQPELMPTDLNRLVYELVADRAHLAGLQGLSLRAEAAPELPPVLADRRMLTQVLSNIVTNAVNYTQVGGEVVVSAAKAAEDDRLWATLVVRDTGPGIAADEAPHIFERFYRGAAARATRKPGTGLGLAICQELVRCHDGRITVDSQVGQGSLFTVWLPLQSTRSPE